MTVSEAEVSVRVTEEVLGTVEMVSAAVSLLAETQYTDLRPRTGGATGWEQVSLSLADISLTNKLQRTVNILHTPPSPGGGDGGGSIADSKTTLKARSTLGLVSAQSGAKCSVVTDLVSPTLRLFRAACEGRCGDEVQLLLV